jgi:hypothetical protein
MAAMKIWGQPDIEANTDQCVAKVFTYKEYVVLNATFSHRLSDAKFQGFTSTKKKS